MLVTVHEGKLHALSRHAFIILSTDFETMRWFFKGLIIPILLGVSKLVDSGLLDVRYLSSVSVRGSFIQVIMVLLLVVVEVTWEKLSFSV